MSDFGRVPSGSFQRQKTDPRGMAAYGGPERRMLKPRPSPWKKIGAIAGTVVAVLAAVGMIMRWAQPSVVQSLDLATRPYVDEKVQQINQRFEDGFKSVDSKLDVLIKLQELQQKRRQR